MQPALPYQSIQNPPQGPTNDKQVSNMVWPVQNTINQVPQSTVPNPNRIGLNQTTSLIGNKGRRPRPTTAGQLLDNLNDSHDYTDEQSVADSENASSKSSKEIEGKYLCPHRGCWKTFSRKLRLNAHLHLHYGTQPFKCTFPGCGKAFSEKQNLRIHMRIHVDERPFQCPQGCGKSFRTKGNMRDHERRHFGDK